MLLAYGAAPTGGEGTSPPGAHRFWRINIAANDGDPNYVSIGELQFFSAESGGTDLFDGGSYTYSASHELGGDVAANAVGNSNSTEWVGQNDSAFPVWWKVDFGAGNPKEVLRFTMASQRIATGRTPTSFTLEYSDDNSNWAVAGTYVSAGWGTLQVRKFGVMAHRYWQINSVAVAGDFLAPSEIQLYDALGNNVNSGATVTANDPVESGSPALSNLTDGDLNTRCYWTSAVANDSPFYIRWDLGPSGAKKIVGVKQGGYNVSDECMESFDLQFSDDGSSWTTFGSSGGPLTYPGDNTLSGMYWFSS